MNDPQLLQDARNAAQHMTVKWIRSVFRELSYQLLKDHWKVEHVEHPPSDAEDTGTATTCRLHLTTELLEQSQQACRKLADRWCHRLTAMGHYDVAEWVQQVVLNEGPCVFFTPENDDAPLYCEGKNQRGNSATEEDLTNITTTSPGKTEQGDGDESVIEINNGGPPPANENDHGDNSIARHESQTATTTNSAPDSPSRERATAFEATDPSPTTTENDLNNSNNNSTTTTDYTQTFSLATLRKMCTPRAMELSDEDRRAMIAQLDRMGYDGKTLWPHDWDVIQRAAEKIPQRCHSKVNTNSPYQAGFQLQLVSKAQLQQQLNAETDGTTGPATGSKEGGVNQGNEHHDDSDDGIFMSILSTRTEKFIAKKKRKKQMAQNEDNTGQPMSKVARTKDHEHFHDVPRPPSTVAESKEPWNEIREELSSSCHVELMSYLHPDDREQLDQETPSNILLGALKPVGQVHYCIQAPWDDPDYIPISSSQSNSATQKKLLRRRLRKATRERLGPHQEEKDVKEPRDRWSRILRTASTTADDFFHLNNATRNDPGGNEGDGPDQATGKQYWWDLDLGECLLELIEDEPNSQHENDGSQHPPKPKRRTLCAFSSLEIMLLDEGADDTEGERTAEPAATTVDST